VNFDDFVARFPNLWHATFPGGWDGIQQSGLRPSLDLLTAAGREGEASELREEQVTLSLPEGEAVLRAQTPNRKDPAPYLDGITAEEWYRLLNGRSYFYVSRDDVDKMVAASLELGIAQDVATFQTRRLLTPVVDQVQVATVNATTFPRASGAVRGPGTFQALADFAGVPTKIKEVTVTAPIKIEDSAVISVVRHAPDEANIRIFPKIKVRS
jgi:hypothetical protein